MHVFYPNQNQKPTKTSTTGFFNEVLKKPTFVKIYFNHILWWTFVYGLIKTDEIPPVFDLFFYLWLAKFHQAKHKVHV
ncbi:hypothetical protein MC25239_01526 [Moraxella catarrhalis]|nr:hypothetical protein DR90_350 [Moraxella catarrhalis]AIT43912.1 hypothetical protein MC25239_01526 [Moraxella catarrhalis]